MMIMFSGNPLGDAVSGIFGGMFGDSGRPYQDAMDQYERWARRGQEMQNPFWQAGVGAIPDFQQWLGGMKDPSGFINNLMGNYEESPWAKYAQQAAERGAQNMGSASGLTGSTPMAQFMQQNAKNISSQDMQNWLQNVLGVNTQYGAGQGMLMQGGQGAANALTNMFGDMGQRMGEGAFYKRRGQQFDRNSIWGGLMNAGLGMGLF